MMNATTRRRRRRYMGLMSSPKTPKTTGIVMWGASTDYWTPRGWWNRIYSPVIRVSLSVSLSGTSPAHCFYETGSRRNIVRDLAPVLLLADGRRMSRKYHVVHGLTIHNHSPHTIFVNICVCARLSHLVQNWLLFCSICVYNVLQK